MQRAGGTNRLRSAALASRGRRSAVRAARRTPSGAALSGALLSGRTLAAMAPRSTPHRQHCGVATSVVAQECRRPAAGSSERVYPLGNAASRPPATEAPRVVWRSRWTLRCRVCSAAQPASRFTRDQSLLWQRVCGALGQPAVDRNQANPMVGCRVQQTCTACAEQAVEAVRTGKDGRCSSCRKLGTKMRSEAGALQEGSGVR